MAVSLFRHGLFQSRVAPEAKKYTTAAENRNPAHQINTPGMPPIDRSADKSEFKKKSILDRARAMFHFHKEASFNKANPLKDMARYKERINKLIVDVKNAATWKQRAASAEKIRRYIQKAEKKLHMHNYDLNAHDVEALSKELGELLQNINKAKDKTNTSADERSEQLQLMFGPNAVATDIKLQRATQIMSALDVASQQIESMLARLSCRPQLTNGLQKIKNHFNALLKENWSPEMMETHYDAAMLPLLVAAENKRSPDLNLTLLSPHENFGDWLGNWQKHPDSANARVMFPLPNYPLLHYVTADIKRDEQGNISVLVVDPTGLDAGVINSYEKNTLPALQEKLNSEALKDKVSLKVLALATQKSDSGCHIFGLSSASKMADATILLDTLHKQNLAGEEFKSAKGEEAETLAGENRIKLINGESLMPVSFLKHSQSKTTLDRWLAQSPPDFSHASVNKAKQTLMERYEGHQTTRYKASTPDISLKELRVGTSIEKKRLTYIDRALNYLSKAPVEEVEAFWQHFNDTIEKGGGMPEAGNLHLEKRKLGAFQANS